MRRGALTPFPAKRKGEKATMGVVLRKYDEEEEEEEAVVVVILIPRWAYTGALLVLRPPVGNSC